MLRILVAAWAALTLPVTFAHAFSEGSGSFVHYRPETEPAQPVTLSSALELAMRANPKLAAARHEADAVEGSVQQAHALPNPSIEVVAEDRRPETRTTTWLLSQPLELGGKRDARIATAMGERDAVQADLTAVTAELRANVITAFFEVFAAQERLRLAQTAVDLAKAGTQAASRRVAAGKISPVEATKAQVAQANVQLEYAQAKTDLAAARRRLAALWGNPSPRFTQVNGWLDALPMLPDAADVDRRLAQAPTLLRAKAEVSRRQGLADLERARRMPDVTLTMGVKREEEFDRRQAVVGISVPLPLFDRNSGNVRQAQRQADKARDELAATEMQLYQDVAQAREQLMLSRDEVDTLQKDILPGAQGAYDAARTGFDFGKFSFLDVLDAQRTLLEAQSRYLKALAQAHRAAADLDRLLGTTAANGNPFSK